MAKSFLFLFVYMEFYWNRATYSSFYVSSTTTFMSQSQSLAVVTETSWLTKSEIFTIWALIEKVCLPLTYYLGQIFILILRNFMMFGKISTFGNSEIIRFI